MSKLYLTLKFKFYRTGKGWTQQQMADYLSVGMDKSVSRSAIQKWEQAHRTIEPVDAMRISELTGISYKDLVERKQ